VSNLSIDDVPTYIMLKSTKDKDAIIADGYYYNWIRDNKATTVYKCRHHIVYIL
jgi:hypothetical protein